jgi:Tol biopolymer transport system component
MTERGQVLLLTASRDDESIPATWSADAGAVEWIAPNRARLLRAGTVRFNASVNEISQHLDVTVTAPPAIAFERIEDGNRDIWRAAIDGGEVQRLSSHEHEYRSPSTVAGYVYFVEYAAGAQAVYEVAAAGGGTQRITTAGDAFGDAAISPDGTRIVFTRTVSGTAKIFVSDRSGANARRVTVAGGGTVVEASPAWSPDGTHVAFVSTSAGNADVYVADVEEGGVAPIAVTPAPEVEPAWSPDGREIAFTRAADPRSSDVFAVRIADGAVRRLTTTQRAARPLWLPDGRLAFVQYSAGRGDVTWIDPQRPDVVHAVPIVADGPLAAVK